MKNWPLLVFTRPLSTYLKSLSYWYFIWHPLINLLLLSYVTSRPKIKLLMHCSVVDIWICFTALLASMDPWLLHKLTTIQMTLILFISVLLMSKKIWACSEYFIFGFNQIVYILYESNIIAGYWDQYHTLGTSLMLV